MLPNTKKWTDLAFWKLRLCFRPSQESHIVNGIVTLVHGGVSSMHQFTDESGSHTNEESMAKFVLDSHRTPLLATKVLATNPYLPVRLGNSRQNNCVSGHLICIMEFQRFYPVWAWHVGQGLDVFERLMLNLIDSTHIHIHNRVMWD